MKKELFIDLSGLDALKDTNLPDPSLLEYYKLLNNRSISINYDIADDIVEYSHKIIEWNREDNKNNVPVDQRKPIKIFVNTNGGCLNSILCLINIIKLSKTPVYTIAMGKVYSAGFLLMLAGHRRFCLESSDGLLHSGSFGIMNSTEKVMDYIDHTRKIEKKVREYVVNSSKITDEEYDRNYRNEWYMTSDEMIKYGIVDELITDMDMFL